MTATARHFLVVKDGNPPEHNDDAAAADPARGRFAISDGIAEGGFSRVWSRILVENFVCRSASSPDDWQAWLPAAQGRWLAELHEVEIPWYGEKQFEQGSFATFLGLVLTTGENSNPSWHAAAVGDSCLFHIRDGQLLGSFPLDHSSQFDSYPGLVGSRSSIAEIAGEHSRFSLGLGQPGDHLWLMSDALSQWSLAETESGRPPWQELAQFLDPHATGEQFAAWIAELRATRGLHNDDVTLLGIEL